MLTMQWKVLNQQLKRYLYPEHWTLIEVVVPLTLTPCSLRSRGRNQGGHRVTILSLRSHLFTTHVWLSRTLSQNWPLKFFSFLIFETWNRKTWKLTAPLKKGPQRPLAKLGRAALGSFICPSNPVGYFISSKKAHHHLPIPLLFFFFFLTYSTSSGIILLTVERTITNTSWLGL